MQLGNSHINSYEKRYLLKIYGIVQCSSLEYCTYDDFAIKESTKNYIKMCDSCEKEYTDPLSRRFHAQLNCCEKCEPFLMLINNKREAINL